MTAEFAPRLDPKESHLRIAGPEPGLSLFLRHLPPSAPRPGGQPIVLYVHGATFPSALSIAHRFDGRSWRDQLCDAGFHVWGLDFHGFGLSDPYPGLQRPAGDSPPLGRAAKASRQLEAAARAILAHHGAPRLSIIAHSWGSMAAGAFAGRCPELVDRLVFFGPITWRAGDGQAPRLPGWRLISLRDQWERFVADVPEGEAPVLSRRHFEQWGERYLALDPDSALRSPPAVKTPAGPSQEILDAWAGKLAYEPAGIQAPVAIIRGEWDSLCTDEDARWLFDRLTCCPVRCDVKIGRGTHLMHLESGRAALYREAAAFLLGGVVAQGSGGSA